MGRPKGSKNKSKVRLIGSTKKAKRNKMAENVVPENEVPKEVKPEVKTEVPVTSVPEDSEEVKVAIDDSPEVTQVTEQDCPNCLNHNRVTRLSDNGTCSVCGFDKSKLYGAF